MHTPLLPPPSLWVPENSRYFLMAAVSISPLPHTLPTMSTRRVPLSSNPNAANSPYRALQGAASKQKRSYATIQREDAYGQPPPAKKQMLDVHQVLRTPPRQQSTQSSAEGRVFTRKSNASQQSSFERRLVAVRDKPVQQQVVTKADKTTEENLDTIRQWQKHYRKIFPTFVFYFESIPEDVRLKYTKQVIALGAVSNFLLFGSSNKALLTIYVARRKVLFQCRHSRCDYTNPSSSNQPSRRSCSILHYERIYITKQPASDY